MNNRIGIDHRHVATMLVMLVILAIAALIVHHDSNAAGKPAVAELPLAHVADIPLPGRASRLDYESVDPDRHLLFIAHLGDSEVIVVDTQTSRVVARIGNIAAVHGVLVVPELSRVYASATGTNEVVAIDEATLKITARMPGGVYPDGMAYAPDMRKLYVSDETGGTETVIDTQSNRRLNTIPLGGTIGNSQYDAASRHIFVNAQSRRQLVEIDPSNDSIVARIDLPGAKGNHGLYIVPHLHLAFVACEDNARLLELNLRTKEVLQSFDVGDGPDVLAFDPGRGTLFVAGEAGIVSMFAVGSSTVSKTGEGSIGPNAHVVGVDPSTHRVYFPLKNVDGRPVLRVMAPR
ncbi:YncE family protein [Paraburkholderia diazotrophica]|uniref:DNA-binding beta-propeller fold protein YncE n=1 Tax=Paraburkholderia diazotrophica TaxID=667676 RepID=A0A1H6YWH8_9BURK|nr:YncE family protein [Paraburkholderia diazotrophica]SEJ45633.1 DNA-binding beta-propeller fold protein YncE [Paraburkholderia diazotrophica]